jgi:chromosome partitioning protein
MSPTLYALRTSVHSDVAAVYDTFHDYQYTSCGDGNGSALYPVSLRTGASRCTGRSALWRSAWVAQAKRVGRATPARPTSARIHDCSAQSCHTWSGCGRRRGLDVRLEDLVLSGGLVWFNQKGGVGKTSHTANHAVSCAASGWRVLALDLDPQGSLARALGYVSDERWDGGQALQDAISTEGRMPFTVLSDVRPNLDVIGGGPACQRVADTVNSLVARDPEALFLFDRLLGPIADQYDLILFDLPPTISALHLAVLTSAHFVVVPVTPNPLAIDGLSQTLTIWRERRRTSNPDLEILAVVVGTLNLQATRARAEMTQALRDLPESIPVLEPPVRFYEAADAEMKLAGRVAIEMERDVDEARKQRFAWLRTRQGPAPLQPSASVKNMADDYTSVFVQVTELLATAQARSTLDSAVTR